MLTLLSAYSSLRPYSHWMPSCEKGSAVDPCDLILPQEWPCYIFSNQGRSFTITAKLFVPLVVAQKLFSLFTFNQMRELWISIHFNFPGNCELLVSMLTEVDVLYKKANKESSIRFLSKFGEYIHQYELVSSSEMSPLELHGTRIAIGGTNAWQPHFLHSWFSTYNQIKVETDTPQFNSINLINMGKLSLTSFPLDTLKAGVRLIQDAPAAETGAWQPMSPCPSPARTAAPSPTPVPVTQPTLIIEPPITQQLNELAVVMSDPVIVDALNAMYKIRRVDIAALCGIAEPPSAMFLWVGACVCVVLGISPISVLTPEADHFTYWRILKKYVLGLRLLMTPTLVSTLQRAINGSYRLTEEDKDHFFSRLQMLEDVSCVIPGIESHSTSEVNAELSVADALLKFCRAMGKCLTVSHVTATLLTGDHSMKPQSVQSIKEDQYLSSLDAARTRKSTAHVHKILRIHVSGVGRDAW